MAVKKFTSRAELHDEVQVVFVIVGLKVLDDVGVIDLLEQVDLVHDRGKIFGGHLVLAEHLDCDLVLWTLPVDTLVNFAEGTFSEDMAIDIVDLLQLMYTCHDFHLRGLLIPFKFKMVLVVATLYPHILVHLRPLCALSRRLFAVRAAHISSRLIIR